MLKNYIVTAYKVLLRRKFFTFIGLFGIALTLSVLLILSALLDNLLFPSGPQANNQHFVVINRLTTLSEDGGNTWSSRPGYYFLTHNVARLKSPEKMSFFSTGVYADSYIDGDKLSNKLRHTDVNYWDILDFEFVAGKPFDQAAYDKGEMVMVINQSTAKEFFADQTALGQSIVVNQQKFTVIGVVRDFSSIEEHAHADMWVPTTTRESTKYKSAMMGGWNAMLYHSDPSQIEHIQSEYIHLLKNDFQRVDPVQHHKAISAADKPLERLARSFTNSRGFDSGIEQFIVMISVLVGGFMLLPSINLINLNVSRMMERASEIGVRKAFGASSGHLVIQFIIENILITFVGAIVGLILSYLVLWQVNEMQLLPMFELTFSFRTFIYGLVFILIFGLLSGSIPAYKMSKLHPVNALKGGAQSC